MKELLILFCCVILVNSGCREKDSDPINTVVPDKPVAFIYVANENGESVSVINAAKMQKVMDIDVSDNTVSMIMPHNVQAAPDGKTVWVTAVGMAPTDMDQLIVIDPFTNQIIKRIYLGKNLHLAHIVLDKNCENAFVTAYNTSKVFQVDAKSFNIVNTFNLDTNSGPHGLRYSNGKLYIASMTAKCMNIIDVAASQVTNVPLGGIAIQTAVTQNGKHAFISLYDTKEVVKYDLESKKITKICLPSGSQGPVQLYATPDNKKLYVCDQGALFGGPVSNRVFVIDIEKASVINTITAGMGPHGVVISNDGKYAFITNASDNTVYVIDTNTDIIKASIPTGPNPNGISYWYGSGGMP